MKNFKHMRYCYTLIFLLGIQSFAMSASKYPATGENGMVVTSHQLATNVGIQILRNGGNAVDAAVGVGFALAVVFPTAGNLGGGGFMVIQFSDKSATSIDYREKAPLKAFPEMYLDEHGNVIPDLSLTGYLASGVPGSVAGLTLALEKYGTMSLKEVIAPAIRFAREGFPVSPKFVKDMERLQPVFSKFPASASKFIKEDGNPYQSNDLFKQPKLAKTLTKIAKNGAVEFYRGSVARLIVDDMKKNNGLISMEDLAAYEAVERDPVTGFYKDFKIISMGPPSSGGIAIVQSLKMLEHFDLREMGFHSSRHIHILTEVLKRAFHDRAIHIGDPDFVDIPTNKLLNDEYIRELCLQISTEKALPSMELSDSIKPVKEGNHTTHYSVVDKNDMAVSVTTTINTGYGSKVVIKGAGFLMNNEMDDFAVKPGTPNSAGLVTYSTNAIQPGKRMLSSMSPTIITYDDKVFMTVGSMGGPAIITAVLQIILNVIDFDMNIQEAVDAPRVHHQWLPDTLFYERFAFPADVQIRLKEMGHSLSRYSGYSSEAHAIRILRNGTVTGAADPRFEGVASGF